MRFLPNIFKRRKKRNKLIVQLKKQASVLNPEEVADQILKKSPIIQYNYKKHQLYINNEKSALYHIINSTEKVEKLVDAIDLDKCNIVLDIGANTGLFTYFIKKKFPDAIVYLFEPDERLIPVVKKNIDGLNNCFIVPFAVSNTDNEEITFYVNPNSAQTNSTIKEAITTIDKKAEIITKNILTTTIDTFCLKKSISNVDVLKIDIQGGEYTALSKATAILPQTKVLLAEMSFFVEDTIDLLNFIRRYFKKYKPVNAVFMGADLKFYN